MRYPKKKIFKRNININRETTKKSKNKIKEISERDFQEKSSKSFVSKSSNTISKDSNSFNIWDIFFELESLDISKEIKLQEEKEIIIRKCREEPSDEIVSLDKIKDLLRGNKIEELQNNSFLYTPQSEFNYRKQRIGSNNLAHLFFYLRNAFKI